MRRRLLPYGWYPQSQTLVAEHITAWNKELQTVQQTACAAIAPHAGWFFSGKLAWLSWLSAYEADCVVIAGGHLGARQPLVVYADDSYEVPSGELPVSQELMKAVMSKYTTRPETSADNTVEIQLPLCAERFGKTVPVLGLRVPEDEQAESLGIMLAKWCTTNKKKLFVLGSTDLTHYGPNYGFIPAGIGANAQAWAKRNDRSFIDACLAMDSKAILHTGRDQQAACSSGAVLCAVSFAKAMLATHAQLQAYDTSLSKHPDDSFVGYCSITFSQPC